MGETQGRATLQTIPASDPEGWVGKVDGFSLHAGVATKAQERKKLERQYKTNRGRYIARPAVSEQRLSLTCNGMVRYELKRYWTIWTKKPPHRNRNGYHGAGNHYKFTCTTDRKRSENHIFNRLQGAAGG